jgi:hypothetical protein
MRKKIAAILCVMIAGTTAGWAQAKSARAGASVDYKASPAFAELRLKKSEIESEVESLSVEYTEEYPKLREARATLGFVQKEIDRLAALGPNAAPRLTPALGKLMVRKAELETEVWRLLETLQPAHPDVKRARRRVEIFEAAIKEILG